MSCVLISFSFRLFLLNFFFIFLHSVIECLICTIVFLLLSFDYYQSLLLSYSFPYPFLACGRPFSVASLPYPVPTLWVIYSVHTLYQISLQTIVRQSWLAFKWTRLVVTFLPILLFRVVVLSHFIFLLLLIFCVFVYKFLMCQRLHAKCFIRSHLLLFASLCRSKQTYHIAKRL